MAGALLKADVLEALGEGAPGWPWATFAVNVAGAFLLGAFVTAIEGTAYMLAGTAVLGTYTTFST